MFWICAHCTKAQSLQKNPHHILSFLGRCPPSKVLMRLLPTLCRLPLDTVVSVSPAFLPHALASKQGVSRGSTCQVRHHTPTLELHFHHFKRTVASNNALTSLQAVPSDIMDAGHAQVSAASKIGHPQHTGPYSPQLLQSKEVWALRGAPGAHLSSIY